MDTTSNDDQVKENIKTILKRIAKMVTLILLLKWIRWQFRSNPELYETLDPLIQSGQAANAIQILAILLVFLGIVSILFGLALKQATFLETKVFWFIFASLIVNPIFLFAFPDVPLIFLSSSVGGIQHPETTAEV